MEQHPIPQQITSYEFKLVGEMTLKQFLKAAGGVILAIMINATKLMVLVKWPLMLFFAAGGLALAFVPFQDRPLEVWLTAFVKAIYAPTIYLYKRKKAVNWLDIDLSKSIKSDEEEELVLPQKEGKKVEEFIESLPSIGREKAREEILESRDEILEEKGGVKEEKGKIRIEKRGVEEEKIEKVNEVVPESRVKINLDLKKEKLEATGRAVFGEIPMPDIPDLPNLVVGMVMDNNDKIVEGAIIEIQDKEGIPSRVLKTNQLGQFKTLTQLTDGKYLIVTEKEGLNFDRVEINLKGEIVKPIKILAK